ncbi:hypothetical protein PHLCEN_2v9628 [Hermanssonia centrifuga]|uniref:F-box domain-containing protein n=1 Tax=Hermanssonia centrifuga TaxID=98765 RepID=A0A2R6NQE6_9APHY|nr:hypothetical protein PHLCEN_2v9628 [Hermanssonia centrifuga]
MATTHQLFFISELVERILEQLKLEARGHDDRFLRYVPDRKSLFAMSRTCKALSEISLDALWKEMDTLLPVFNCMPAEAFQADDPELAISISSAYAKVVNPDSAHLDPLIHLTRLESVSFKGVNFDLTDAIIQRLISAWGNLKKFYVHSRSRSSEGAPPVSLAVLRLFAAYTPKLEDLRINLDATCVPSCDSQDSVRASVLPVHMDFDCSPIQMLGNPRQVIEYIANIYPHAIIHSTPKYCCAPQGCKYHDTWKQVGETIASMATLSENSIPKFQN